MPNVAAALAFAVAYFIAAEAGQRLSIDAQHFATFWPASGLYLTVLLASPIRNWPALMLAALVGNSVSDVLVHARPLAVSSAYWLGNTLEATVGATLLRRTAGDAFRLDSVGAVLALTVLAALGATALGASVGAFATMWFFGAPLLATWLVWWSADALGVLLVAPLVLAAIEAPPSLRGLRPLRALEGGVLLAAIVVIALWAFSGGSGLPYMVIPLLLWAALRFGVGGAATACALFAIVAVRLTALGHGPFADLPSDQKGVLAQMLLSVYTLTALVIAALFRQQRRDEAQLRELNATLERRVEERTRDLAESEQRYRTLVELAPDAIFVNLADRIVFANAACARLLGAPNAEALLGKSPLEFIHSDYHEAVIERIGRVLLEGAVLPAIEEKFIRCDGSIIDVEVAAAPYDSAEGRAVQVLARDVTERKRAEQALKEADRRKDEFLAMLAHELRNPLAPIRNAVEIFRIAAPNDPALRSSSEMIARQVKHLAKLVDDLLDISRITRGKIKLNKEVVDLVALIGQAVELARPAIESRRHRLDIELPRHPLHVEADPTRLVQIAGNLLDNAAKYTPEAGHILIAVEAAGSDAVIRVRDNGIGIPAELLPHVFDLFTQAERSLDRSQGGLGIGLALVRSLVELHDGSVAAHSAGAGQGSEFVVELPLAKQGQADSTSTPSPPRLASTPFPPPRAGEG